MNFKSEREMQDLFISVLSRKYDYFYHLFEEVNTSWGRPDIVKYRNLNNIWTYELKLNNSKKVWFQAWRNSFLSHRSYIVVPEEKGNKIPKGLDITTNQFKHIGILEFDGKEIKIIKKSKNHNLEIRKEILLHSLATQQYKGGMRMFNSYK